MDGKWLSILEYASYKKKSISTVRRYIKADRVKSKEEDGKYFIWTRNFIDQTSSSDKEILNIKFENERLKKELRLIKEEMGEMQMLITIYEQEKKSLIHSDIPSIPEETDLPELPTEF